jgi:hypothetical protein
MIMVRKKRPLRAALNLLVVSILVRIILINFTNRSLIGWITILTFSRGIIIMMIYTSRSTPNEKEKRHQTAALIPALVLMQQKNTVVQHSTKLVWFSLTPQIILIATILTITILTLMEKCFNPTRATKTSF